MNQYKASILFTDNGVLHLCVGTAPVVPKYDSVAIATVQGTPKDIPDWMIDAYQMINQVHPETLLEAKLIASISKARGDKHG